MVAALKSRCIQNIQRHLDEGHRVKWSRSPLGPMKLTACTCNQKSSTLQSFGSIQQPPANLSTILSLFAVPPRAACRLRDPARASSLRPLSPWSKKPSETPPGRLLRHSELRPQNCGVGARTARTKGRRSAVSGVWRESGKCRSQLEISLDRVALILTSSYVARESHVARTGPVR